MAKNGGIRMVMAKANELAAVQRCLYGNENGYCGVKAILHIWLAGDFATMSCAAHIDWWNAHPSKDQHPIVGACGLPNTIWKYTNADSPGWCEVEGMDIQMLAETIAAIIVVTA
jgi:hypothetical protein